MNELLKLYPLKNYPSQTRVHHLSSFSTDKANVFVKREDELGATCSGPKLRKYLSLIPYLASSRLPVAIVGSPYSNHVMLLSLLLTEEKIPYTLFLQGKQEALVKGNFFFTLLCNPKEEIIWIEKDLYFEEIASSQQALLKQRFTWIPIGGSAKQSLPGALTLAQDILRNEREDRIFFDHIFIDAGTGFTAASLLLGLGYADKKTVVHIVQAAGGELEFYVMLEDCKRFFQDLFGIEGAAAAFDLTRPKKARSFGSVSAEHLQFIKIVAREEGLLLDPMYNSKLFLEAKQRIQQEKLEGNILLIHSGGTFSLSGFSDRFTDL